MDKRMEGDNMKKAHWIVYYNNEWCCSNCGKYQKEHKSVCPACKSKMAKLEVHRG